VTSSTGFVNALITAAALPIGALVSLLVARSLSTAWYVLVSRRPLPIVIHPLTFEHNFREFVRGQPESLLELPSRIRDFISTDPTLTRHLAPGPINPTSPQIPSSAPDPGGTSGWAAQLLNLVYPQRRAAFNVHLIPEVGGPGQIAVGVQVVRSPREVLISAQSFRERDVAELALTVGAFCVEAVMEQSAMLRRTPRWEHWSGGGYSAFRRAVHHQQAGRFTRARHHYEEAGRRSPGNARLALYNGSLYELRKDYRRAAYVYDAIHCLWRQNVDVMYRLAAARMNHAQNGGATDVEERIRIVRSACSVLDSAIANLSLVQVWRRLLRTFRPRRRDLGERRYWFAWLRPDDYRRPLVLLRRSKRFEYTRALQIAREGNELLALLLEQHMREPTEEDREAVHRSWRRVTALVRARRIGWLAHWSAACYFSRATLLPPQLVPEWEGEWRRVQRSMMTRGQSLVEIDQVHAWKTYCEVVAIGELGRVLRNPCNQLNTDLLKSDPDMQRLHGALKGQLVAVLAGLDSLISPETEGRDGRLRRFEDGL
jgi:tetratricopeptide (TPR) repeat protein